MAVVFVLILIIAVGFLYFDSLVSSMISLAIQSEIPLYKFVVALVGTFYIIRMILQSRVENIQDEAQKEQTQHRYSCYMTIIAVAMFLFLPFAMVVSEEGGGYDKLLSKDNVTEERDTSNYYFSGNYKNTSSYSTTTSASTSKRDKCGAEGCSLDKGNNGTVFCDSHARAYVAEQGYSACADSNCYKRKSGWGSYCYLHTCEWNNCTSKKKEGYDYCSTHQYELEEAREQRNKSTQSNSDKRKPTQTYDMPDCDDYEDYEEFMDDWDGEMPDGSDAEDYWEDW